ncbi:MAG: LysM peptidoglycan-binding domain-containing protein [Deltaproteobacteria bacterium]|nr:LysM peptidoglycan-binding domain-containing protein [Deltaproteobacteria bacterium]MBW2360333.1 LysM peptidoglycan-binding domain-containing protein [Deltaproteobacteria bacterium]
MRTPRLLNLGCALLAFGVGLPTSAEELAAVPATPEEVVPEAGETAQAPQGDATAAAMPASAEPLVAAAEPASDMQAAVAEASEAVAPSTDDSASGPSQAAAAGVPAVPVGEAKAAPMQLGAVGYDDQGREGRVHMVSPGDTLWDISDGYLGTPWVWPSIWHDNRNIENPHLIFPGDRIWITPWEMRKVTPAQAEALLAGEPAAADAMPDLFAPSEVPLPAAAAPVGHVVLQEQVTVLVSDRERAGLVSAEVVDASASLIANVSPRLMISETDRVWIGLAEGETRVGDQFTIYRAEEKVYDPETGRMLGYHVAFLGWLEVMETHDESSLALVRKSSAEIEVGDKLMPRVPPQNQVAVTGAGAGVEGQISFMAQSRTNMGSHDLVYLNRGTLDGVNIGTPLTVFRKGFRAHDNALGADVQVPDRPVASLLVLRAADEASVALVRATEEELELGDYFRGAAN